MRPLEKFEIIQALQSAKKTAIDDKRLSDAEYFNSFIDRLMDHSVRIVVVPPVEKPKLNESRP